MNRKKKNVILHYRNTRGKKKKTSSAFTRSQLHLYLIHAHRSYIHTHNNNLIHKNFHLPLATMVTTFSRLVRFAQGKSTFYGDLVESSSSSPEGPYKINKFLGNPFDGLEATGEVVQTDKVRCPSLANATVCLPEDVRLETSKGFADQALRCPFSSCARWKVRPSSSVSGSTTRPMPRRRMCVNPFSQDPTFPLPAPSLSPSLLFILCGRD